jgi:hypothetical protein
MHLASILTMLCILKASMILIKDLNVKRQLGQLLALIAISVMPGIANATLTSQVQLSFTEAGFTTTFSQIYNAGDDIQFTETFGGYVLLISADSDNLYGQSALGTNPFLSLTVQVSNGGANLPTNPVLIGMSITGLSAKPGDYIQFDSSFTGIFHTAATANFHTYYDSTNTLFGRTGGLSRFDGLSSQSNSNDQTLSALISTPYSMSIYVMFNPVANSHPTLDGQLTATDLPEPATLPILGLAVLGLGVAGLTSRGRGKKPGALGRP